MRMHYDVIIVGTGHAGAQLAVTLRQLGYAGSVGMIGEEPHLPYERPPLSKEFLSGEKTAERIMIRPASFWENKGIEWLGSTKVIQVDPSSRTVQTQCKKTLSYQTLVWAAGGAARRLSLPGGDADNVHVVRTRTDVEAIMQALPQVERVTVIGGGYIGLEAAAVLRKFQKEVTLLEAGPRVLSRVAGEQLSRFYEGVHRDQGVDVRLNVSLDGFALQAGLVRGVVLSDGEVIPTDIVIVGIGIEPSVEALRAAGADVSNGVLVDSNCRTSLADVYAIGDCAAHQSRFCQGEVIRIESVQNANDQAKTVASDIVGQDFPYESIPWFWSNQYDLKLQTMGLSRNHDKVLIRGSMETTSFSVLYLREGKLIAIDAVNCVKDYVQAKELIGADVLIDLIAAVNPDIPLKHASLLSTAS